MQCWKLEKRNSCQLYPKDIISDCIFIYRKCVHEMCLVENISVAATINNRNTEVTIEVIKCKPFEKCVDANTDIGGQKYGYNI